MRRGTTLHYRRSGSCDVEPYGRVEDTTMSATASPWIVAPISGGYGCMTDDGIRLNPWPFSQRRCKALAAIASGLDASAPPTGDALNSLCAFLRAFCAWSDTHGATRTETAESVIREFTEWARDRVPIMRETGIGRHYDTVPVGCRMPDGYSPVPWPAWFTR